jgi:hypothetical protein
MIPQSAESKKIAVTALEMIRDFGGSASVDAFEAANAMREEGDKEREAFYLAVAEKIDEFYGR